MFTHLSQKLPSVDVYRIDAGLLIEHVDKEADPGTFAILWPADRIFEAYYSGIHRCAPSEVIVLIVEELVNFFRTVGVLLAIDFLKVFHSFSIFAYH